MGKLNKFDYLIILMISLLAFGQVGGAFQPIRLLAIALIPFNMVNMKVFAKAGSTKYFLVFWFLYIVLSMMWTPNRAEGVADIVYFLIHFSLFISLYIAATKANNFYVSILLGWCLFIASTLPIAFNELINDVHLKYSKREGGQDVNYGGGVILAKRFAAVTFFNYNTYVTYISMALPFILSMYNYCYNRFAKLLFWGLYLSIVYVLLSNASRGGFLVLGINSVAFLYFNYRYKRISLASLILILAVGTYMAIRNFENIAYQLLARFDGGTSLTDASSRTDIYLTALKATLHTAGMGAGAGGLDNTMSQFTNDITATHNLWLEILAQYGFVIFILFVIFIGRIFIRLVKSKSLDSRTLGYFVVATILPLSIINSGYLTMPTLWIYLASLYTISKLKR